jgi:hypothetical protein
MIPIVHGGHRAYLLRQNERYASPILVFVLMVIGSPADISPPQPCTSSL